MMLPQTAHCLTRLHGILVPVQGRPDRGRAENGPGAPKNRFQQWLAAKFHQAGCFNH